MSEHLRSAESMPNIKGRRRLYTTLGVVSFLALVFLPFDLEIGSGDTALFWKRSVSSHMEWGAAMGRFYIECELCWENPFDGGVEISPSEVRLGNFVVYFGR